MLLSSLVHQPFFICINFGKLMAGDKKHIRCHQSNIICFIFTLSDILIHRTEKIWPATQCSRVASGLGLFAAANVHLANVN